MSDSESFRSCSSVGSEEERSGDGDSQPGVGIQPFDLRLLDTATNRRRDRREVPAHDGPVEVKPTVLLEVPQEVSVPGGQEMPVPKQCAPEGTREEVPLNLGLKRTDPFTRVEEN